MYTTNDITIEGKDNSPLFSLSPNRFGHRNLPRKYFKEMSKKEKVCFSGFKNEILTQLFFVQSTRKQS